VIVLAFIAAISLPRDSDAEDVISLDARPPTMMVLNDGRVLYGQISERPGGYMIESPGSKQVVPYELIRLLASSLEDAYVKQRDAMKMPRAGDHLALAQWCKDNKLYALATEQLEAALKLEPNRGEARRMLQEVVDLTQTKSPPAAGRYRVITGGAPVVERTSAGISPGSQTEFVRRVQPILVNRCGNATCHGSASDNSFKLINVRSGLRQQRLETELNLAAVLKQIDTRKPSQSPLLVRPADDASREHRGAFSAVAGASQQQRLREWVLAVAREQKKAAPSNDVWAADDSDFAAQAAYAFGEDPPQSPGNGDIRQLVHEDDVPEPEAPDPQVSESVESPLLIEIPRPAQPVSQPASPDKSRPPATQKSPATPPARQQQSAFVREILEQDRPDAFDPNEFNRKAHGRAGAR